ncbi:MAG: preprotein translocase subunit SecE [Clostridia bacterium]|jgi:preprotein translocase subunit SecE|nr:preprotein translocase subunit SecE [Clostridia bacterium]MBQ4454037.1 preprotein translocase subunit SecE [Clostridia bacterium]MBQ5957342.1 preprotein translocase subunit SecE [Clostridia bacterium]MBR0438305.1 preprotein translocase subunit SecE [Clostridia bacterium]MBR3563717.1 preprotein translocase subunit SecE [Clostridia bacterium]
MAKTVLLGEEKEKKEKAQKKAVKANKQKNKKSIVRWFKDIWSELKKVTWPSKKDLFNYTLAVIAVIVAFAVAIGLIDFGLSRLFRLLIGS